jgi:hypothetical protein
MYWVLQTWRDGATGDIYQFIPVLILLGILLFFIGKMLSAASSTAGGAAPSTTGMSRRSIISGAIWTAVGAVLVSQIFPKIGNEFGEQTPSIGCLTIESDTTHSIKLSRSRVRLY